MKQTHFFLGANSAEGFYGLYDQLLDARLYDLIILKGTPGCGKSTFMRRVAAALEEVAVASLKRAKRGHDALEALYRPCVDFDAVGALCDAEIARIGAYPV